MLMLICWEPDINNLNDCLWCILMMQEFVHPSHHLPSFMYIDLYGMCINVNMHCMFFLKQIHISISKIQECYICWCLFDILQYTINLLITKPIRNPKHPLVLVIILSLVNNSKISSNDPEYHHVNTVIDIATR